MTRVWDSKSQQWIETDPNTTVVDTGKASKTLRQRGFYLVGMAQGLFVWEQPRTA